MQLKKDFLKQIARPSIVAHSCANEPVDARSQRTIQRFESRQASTLVFAHVSIERLRALGIGHVATEKIPRVDDTSHANWRTTVRHEKLGSFLAAAPRAGGAGFLHPSFCRRGRCMTLGWMASGAASIRPAQRTLMIGIVTVTLLTVAIVIAALERRPPRSAGAAGRGYLARRRLAIPYRR